MVAVSWPAGPAGQGTARLDGRLSANDGTIADLRRRAGAAEAERDRPAAARVAPVSLGAEDAPEDGPPACGDVWGTGGGAEAPAV